MKKILIISAFSSLSAMDATFATEIQTLSDMLVHLNDGLKTLQLKSTPNQSPAPPYVPPKSGSAKPPTQPPAQLQKINVSYFVFSESGFLQAKDSNLLDKAVAGWQLITAYMRQNNGIIIDAKIQRLTPDNEGTIPTIYLGHTALKDAQNVFLPTLKTFTAFDKYQNQALMILSANPMAPTPQEKERFLQTIQATFPQIKTFFYIMVNVSTALPMSLINNESNQQELTKLATYLHTLPPAPVSRPPQQTASTGTMIPPQTTQQNIGYVFASQNPLKHGTGGLSIKSSTGLLLDLFTAVLNDLAQATGKKISEPRQAQNISRGFIVFPVTAARLNDQIFEIPAAQFSDQIRNASFNELNVVVLSKEPYDQATRKTMESVILGGKSGATVEMLNANQFQAEYPGLQVMWQKPIKNVFYVYSHPPIGTYEQSADYAALKNYLTS